jgi:sugar (pentulose or hexulose) kinase
VDDLWCLPHFAGALDHAGASGTLVGLREGFTPGDILQGWMQGVAGELRRLRPLLEEAGGVAVSHVVVGGGGAGDDEGGRWGPLLALALTLPVEVVDDPWTGCRGAVMTTLSGESGGDASAGWKAPSTLYPAEERHYPTPEEVRRYFARYDALVEALAGTVLSGFQGSERSS